MWGRADSDMPQEDLNRILKQCTPSRRVPITDDELDGSDELKAIEARWAGRKQPRRGQPSFDAPLIEWYREYQYRTKHPFWFYDEYYYTEDGTLVRFIKDI